jgi:hypothetical protein
MGWELEGMGRGRSVYEQPGAKVDGIAPHKRRDSKYVREGSKDKGDWQRELKGEASKGSKRGIAP